MCESVRKRDGDAAVEKFKITLEERFLKRAFSNSTNFPFFERCHPMTSIEMRNFKRMGNGEG